MQAIRSFLIGCAVVLSTSTAQALQPATDSANFTAALTLFQQEQHAEAYAGFQQLMPFGSADAAYLLGMMYIQELGVDYNPVASLAYLQSAERWGDQRAANVIAQIKPHLSAAEQADAEQRSSAHEEQLLVAYGEHIAPGEPITREAVRRAMPEYPKDAIMEGVHSWLDVIIGIDSRGRIIAVQPLNNADRRFVRAFNRVASSWRFQPSSEMSLQPVRLTYTIGNSATDESVLADVERDYQENLVLASAGVQQNQLRIAGLTQLWIAHDSSAADRLPSANTWYERAARNGSVSAQRYLAIHDGHLGWANYLISQNDLDVMVWHGVRLFTQSPRAEDQVRGKQLVDDAGRAGNRVARDFLRFM